MQQIFSPKLKDKAIETTCSNLIMAELLLPGEVAKFMADATKHTDSEIAEILIESRLLYEKYLETPWNVN